MVRRGPVLVLVFSAGLITAVLAQNTPPTGKGGPTAAAGSDFELVEKLLVARRNYQGSLEQLHAHYLRTNDIERANWVKDEIKGFYYQIDYTLTDVPEDRAYFHAQWRRSNPLPYQTDHTLLDGVRGQGHYVGTYIAWGVNNTGWWGEGEIKFYLDGDGEFPTICGTGTEDYFGGAWNFEHPQGQYGAFSTPYLGLPQVIVPDGLYRSQQRFGMYRWHVPDPIRFRQDLRVTIQALGWRSHIEEKRRYLPLQDDIASTAFWYQAEPHAPFPPLGDANALEVI